MPLNQPNQPWRPISVDDLLARQDLEPRWLIKDFVPLNSRLLLIGAGKSGKSQLALQMSLAIAAAAVSSDHRSSFFGRDVIHPANDQGGVLFIQFDAPPPTWRMTCDMYASAGLVPAKLPLYTVNPDDFPRGFNILDPLHNRHLVELRDACNPCFIVFDSFSKFHYLDEKSSRDMRRVWEVINIIVAGRTALIVHHTRKSQQDEEQTITNAARGNTFITAEADGTLWLRDTMLMSDGGRWMPATSWNIRRNVQTEVWEDIAEVDYLGKVRRLLDICAKHHDLSHRQIHEQHLAKDYGVFMGYSTYAKFMKGLNCVHEQARKGVRED